MENRILIDSSTCKKCLLCVEVCPNKILISDLAKGVVVRDERLHLCFECGQCMAVCSTRSIMAGNLKYEIDFIQLPELDVAEIPFYNLISTRRAIRNFKDKTVPKELLQKIVEIISFSPPSFPPHKIELVVVNNSDLIRKALPQMVENYVSLTKMMKKPMMRHFIKKKIGVRKFMTMENHLIPLLKAKLPEMIKANEDALTRGAPALIFFLVDRNIEDVSEDVMIAATYGMLGIHSLGLGGAIMDIIPPAINRDPELRKLFGIPETHDIITSLTVGYPKYKYHRGIKRNLKRVLWI